MGKYITKWDTTAEYNAVKDNLDKPQVALTKDDNAVHYISNATPPTPSHDYVDLGLPSGTKWATMNVGANSITDYGNYYQYGKGAATYQETSGDTDYERTENPLAASADTAAQVWGGQWHMPTQTQLDELTANTTFAWVTNYQGSGVNGATFTANGQTLFIPAAGGWYYGSYDDVSTTGYIRSSTPNGSNSAYLYFYDSSVVVGDTYREDGLSIRPVMEA